MSTEKRIEHNIAKLKMQINEQYQMLHATRSKHKLVCSNCDKRTQIQNLTLIEIYEDYTNYDEPLARNWKKSKYAIPCPKCNHINLSRTDSEYSNRAKFINDHLFYFKQCIPYHENTRGSLGGLTTRTQERWNQIVTEFIKDKT